MSEQKVGTTAQSVNLDGSCTIYALIDPNTRLLRYIGKTTRRLRSRLNSHCNDRCHCHRTMWIRFLRRRGQRPIIVPLETVSVAESDDTEISMIAFIRSTGAELLNGTDGGEGMKNATPQTRAKMSASRKKHPVNWNAVAAMRAANKGTPKSAETRKKLSRARTSHFTHKENRDRVSDKLIGHEVTEVTRQKLSVAMRGRKHTAETKKKIGDASRLWPRTAETRLKSSNSNKLTWARRQREKEAAAGQLFIGE